MSTPQPSQDPDHQIPQDEEESTILDPAEAEEEIPSDPDQMMDSDPDEEIQLQNDSVAHFDGHKDSIFCIAQHPLFPEIVATGGGDDTGYIFDTTPPEKPVLPASYQSAPQSGERGGIQALYKLEGHTDSVNAITFTLPRGEYVISAGLDGRLKAYRDVSDPQSGRKWTFIAEVQEVEEINWMVPCPHPQYPNTIALGANDGSVWVYTVDGKDQASPLTIVQAFYLHTASCTAGAWTPDGKMLATVSEDASLYVWDVFGEAAAVGLAAAEGGNHVVGLTAQDQRFAVEGGLFSVAVAPTGAFVVVGGADGAAKVVSLPRIGVDPSVKKGAKGAGAANKVSDGKKTDGSTVGNSATVSGQAGQILASLQTQSDSIETLAFSDPSLNLLAAGSVDGSIVLFDTARRFAVRRHIREAHEEFAVVKVEFVKNTQAGGWLLTSSGMDGVVRRFDTRSGTAAPSQGLVDEWRGHRGEGEGGGVLGFVQGGDGERIITAGDE